MTIKPTPYDRLAALAFHPGYRKEYKKLFPSPGPLPLETIFNRSREVDMFKKRWGLEFVVDPEDVECRLGNGIKRDVGGGVFLDYHEHMKVIPTRRAWHDQQRKNSSTTTLNFSKHLRDGRYLTLQIDITADQGKTLEALKDYIKFYRKVIKFNPSKRAKQSKEELDHWVVYKIHQRERKPLLQIARDLYGISGQPAIDEEADAYYKRVKRAYRKAKEIISQIRPITQ